MEPLNKRKIAIFLFMTALFTAYYQYRKYVDQNSSQAPVKGVRQEQGTSVTP